jgi:membrane-bound inhibitor of C-type lysozyme
MKSGFALLATLSLAATSAQATEALYTCATSGAVKADFSEPGTMPGKVLLTFEATGTTMDLPQVVSADGGRYADDKVEFWIKGNEATLTRDGEGETCKTN